jgi:hypothetical protein
MEDTGQVNCTSRLRDERRGAKPTPVHQPRLCRRRRRQPAAGTDTTPARCALGSGKATMMTSHPIRNLASNLEEKRLQLVEKLASDMMSISADAIKELATVQTALTAVREALDEHGPRMGWGSDQELA